MPILKKKSNDKVQILKRINPNPSTLLIVSSAAAEAIKTVNNFSQSFASLVDTHKRMTENLQAAFAPLLKMNEQMADTLTKIALPQIKPLDLRLKTLPNFAELLPKSNSIFDAVQSGFKMAELFKPLDLSYLTEPLRDINKWVKSLIPPKGFFNSIANIANNFINSIKDALKNAVEPFFRFIKSNYLIIVYASKGDKMALNHLGRLWWKLEKRYSEIERLKGRQPNKQEFEQLVQEVCWLVLNEMEKRDTSWLEAARIAFFAISAKLFVDYVEIKQNERLTEATEVKIISGTHRSSPNIYLHENDKPSLFIKTVAQELGVSTQTVRNWVKTGQITGTKVSYFSRLRQAMVPAYLLPYHVNLITQLRTLKNVQDKKKRHQLDGYFTVSQVASWYNLSRKTLERWDRQGLLVPKRINGIRYYTEAQKEEVKEILLNSQYPKFKKLFAPYRLSY